ncbi:MAG: CPBP family intramembrane metalloprotease [Bacteroidetes bacterium]|nr:CPBP family intramembrane metalloprotease [Bacteroidota bacterium]
MYTPKKSLLLLLKASLFIACFIGAYYLFSAVFSLAHLPQTKWVQAISGTTGAWLVTWAFLRFDKKNFASIELCWAPTTLRDFFRGTVAGLIGMGILSVGVIYLSGFHLLLNPRFNIGAFAATSLVIWFLAWLEEISFRGYPLQLLKNKLHPRLVICYIALQFALYHLVFGWPLQTALLGAGSWGIIFTTAAWYSNGIAMATGLHFAVNLVPGMFGTASAETNIWVFSIDKLPFSANPALEKALIWVPQVIVLATGIFLMEWLVKKNRRKSNTSV